MGGPCSVAYINADAAANMAEGIPAEQAIARICHEVSAFDPVIRRASADLINWAAARDIRAAMHSPRFDCAAMDGFAVQSSAARTASSAQEKRFRIVSDIPAQGPSQMVPVGAAAPISTGAPVPDGTDCVIAREACTTDGPHLIVSKPAFPGLNVRSCGEDWRQGASIVSDGLVLTSEDIGALLSCGVGQVWVRNPPTVRIVPTGTELIVPHDASLDGTNASPDARFDSNGPMIAAACRGLGIMEILEPPVPDDAAMLSEALFSRREGRKSDMLITIGGMSAGNHDHVRQVLDLHGARVVFHGVAMRPGKPLLFAILPDGRPFFGLPGNPVAAYMGFRFFVTAAIRRLMGVPPETGYPAIVATEPREGCTLFLRAKRDRRSGQHVEVLADQRSHVMRSLLGADCLIRLDAAECGGQAFVYEKQPHFR